MDDLTESLRRQRIAEFNASPLSREAQEAERGRVWNTGELAEDFDVIGFLAPFCVVRR